MGESPRLKVGAIPAPKLLWLSHWIGVTTWTPGTASPALWSFGHRFREKEAGVTPTLEIAA